MTVDEIIAVVRLTTMVDSGEISDAQLLLWINEGIYDISQREDWPWLEAESTFATVASTASYALSGIASGEEIQIIRSLIRDAQGTPLLPIDHEQALVFWADDVESGTPKYFSVYRERFFLYPIPNAVETINVHYTKAPTELSAGSDSPAWLSTFHNVLVPYVEAKVWQQQEDFAKAQFTFAVYYDRLDMLRRAYSRRLDHGPWAIGSGRNTRTGMREPYRNDWTNADV